MKVKKGKYMAKKGLEIDKIQTVLKDVVSKNGWSLCIGAGTSSPLLPDWYTLVDNLIQNNCKDEDKIDIKLYKKMGFSADAMIQAVKNNLRLSDEEFIRLLSEEIYKPIKNTVTEEEWSAFVKIQEQHNHASVTKEEWECFSHLVEGVFEQTTSNKMARVISKAVLKGVGPRTILTFNGEAIFYALLNYYYMKSETGNKTLYDRVVNSICSRKQERIPYVHCHGIIPINDVKVAKGRRASDKLVFSEDSYLQLANNAFSWQATSFIESCIHNRIVFIGVSLTDANMRRWLSWIHTNKMKEFQENGIEKSDSTEHYWIKKRPDTVQEKLWIEESVAHLGVRLVWIDEWAQVGEVFEKMLAL